MKEMLKNKTILAFVLIVLGIVFISTPSNTVLESDEVLHDEYIVYNLK